MGTFVILRCPKMGLRVPNQIRGLKDLRYYIGCLLLVDMVDMDMVDSCPGPNCVGPNCPGPNCPPPKNGQLGPTVRGLAVWGPISLESVPDGSDKHIELLSNSKNVT